MTNQPILIARINNKVVVFTTTFTPSVIELSLRLTGKADSVIEQDAYFTHPAISLN